METSTRMPDFGELPADPSDAAAPPDASLNDADADAARSEQNILQWMEYLPEDCIRTMIDMGWDITT